MSDAHSNPDPSEANPKTGRLKAALLARGATGNLVWFALLAGLIITSTLVANRCGDDATTSTGAVVATSVPTMEPTSAPTVTPTPEPLPAAPGEATFTIGDEGITLTGVVATDAIATALRDAAIGVVGAARVDDQLTVDAERSAARTEASFTGSVEEMTATVLTDAIGRVVGSRNVDRTMLDVVASDDVVAALNEVFALEPVQFAVGSADILPESVATLDSVAEALLRAPGLRLEVRGHTDSTGDRESNLTLSEARAASVRTYLVAAGVADGQLTASGRGDTEPIAGNTTPEGRQQNRRIEFVIVTS